MAILVDTNIIIDVLTNDPNWADWSISKIEEFKNENLAINPVIFSELSFGYESESEVSNVVDSFGFSFSEIPRKGLFKAAQAFRSYKKNGGPKDFVLPDFFIGGHAEASSLQVLTRDTSRFKTYFPAVDLITP